MTIKITIFLLYIIFFIFAYVIFKLKKQIEINELRCYELIKTTQDVRGEVVNYLQRIVEFLKVKDRMPWVSWDEFIQNKYDDSGKQYTAADVIKLIHKTQKSENKYVKNEGQKDD